MGKKKSVLRSLCVNKSIVADLLLSVILNSNIYTSIYLKNTISIELTLSEVVLVPTQVRLTASVLLIIIRIILVL